MTNRIFIDTDVLIDFLLGREPHAGQAAQIFTKGENGEMELCVSSLCFNNIFYIARKLVGEAKAREILHKLGNLTTVLSVDQAIVTAALASDFKDFEDGIQNFCAAKAGLKIIVTRNIKDFRQSELAVYSPAELLKILPIA